MKRTEKTTRNNSIVRNQICVQPDTSMLNVEDKILEPMVWLMHKILMETEGGAI